MVFEYHSVVDEVRTLIAQTARLTVLSKFMSYFFLWCVKVLFTDWILLYNRYASRVQNFFRIGWKLKFSYSISKSIVDNSHSLSILLTKGIVYTFCVQKWSQSNFVFIPKSFIDNSSLHYMAKYTFSYIFSRCLGNNSNIQT